MSPHFTDRFSGLRLLSGTGRAARRLPVIRQLSASDCGVAALAIVLQYHGKDISVGDVRKTLNPARDGTSAASLLQGARSYGLKGRGVRLELQDLVSLPPGTILHWQFNHFVVLAGVRGQSVDLIDPASGRRTVSMAQCGKAFTGVALICESVDGPGPRRKGRKRPTVDLLISAFTSSGLVVRLVFTSLLVQCLLASPPFIMRLIIDRVVPMRDLSLLGALAIVFCFVQFFGVFADYVRAQLLLYFRTHVELHLTVSFVDRLIDLPYSFFQQHTSGDLLTRLRSNGNVRDILTSATLTGLIDGVMAVTQFVLLGLLSVTLAALVVPLAISRLIVLFAVRSRQKHLMAERLANVARAQTFDVEMLAAMETLKSMGVDDKAAAIWSGLFTEGLNISIRQGRLDATFAGLLASMGVINTLILTFYGSLLVVRGDMSLGTMLACSALATGFLVPLNRLVSTMFQLQTLDVYLLGLDDVYEARPEQEHPGVGKADTVLTGAVALEAVSFAYGEGAPLVVRNVSVRIEAGSLVALVGATGSGKSTIAKLLVGLYNPTDGRVLIQGHDLRRLDLRSVRRQLGMVTQETQLFSGSIRSNIALSDPEMELDAVVRAAQLACVHEEIEMLPMGYETILADRGLSLSGGQRQRIAIARAVARDPKILLLDEATSHLDASTEAAIGRNLARLQCTRVVIAHRLSTVRHADVILFIQSGTIVEAGPHDALVASGGPYAALLGSQLQSTSTSGPT